MADTQNSTSPAAVAYQTDTKNNDQRIGAVGGHESVHATDKTNQDQRYDNAKKGTNNDTEAAPVKVEMQILNETGTQNNQKP